MTVSWSRLCLLVLTFAATLIAAGHGVGPIGLLLALGWEHWFTPVLLGWSSIVVLLAGKIIRGRLSQELLRAGGVLSLVSWVLFSLRAEVLVITLASSLPYLACLAMWFQRTWRTQGAG